MARSMTNVGFAAIAKLLQDIYHVNAIQTTFLVLPFNFAVLFLLIPYNIICQKYGMVIPTRIAVVVMVIGGLVRLLVNESFYFLILGQAIIAIGKI